MPPKIHERFHWAVEQMDIQPTDRILEIGAGHGFAAALICDRLTTGHLTAIDRSDKMTAVASKRNASCLDAGRVDFQTASLEDADFGAAQFDKIFAFNVNVFWTEPGKGLDRIQRWLAPGGTFFLFYMPPSAEWVSYYGDSLNATLQAAGFTPGAFASQSMDKSAVLVVRATMTSN
jgi:ubiquinone/menaquinone biosynthesis C-methylase UbiE